jgi:hypothetical protein
LNVEGWNRVAQSFVKQAEFIHSMFDVRRSLFFAPPKPAATKVSDRAEQ